MGSLHEKGLGVSIDHVKARKYYEKACAAGFKVGCYNLGIFYSKGRGGNVDSKKAGTIFRRACAQGEGRSCAAIGDSLEKGDAEDTRKALLFYEKGCTMGASRSCFKYGELSFNAGSMKAALEGFSKACKGGYKGVRGCVFSNWMRVRACDKNPAACKTMQATDSSQSVEYSNACKKGVTAGCANGGLILEYQTEKDANVLKRIHGFYKTGCEKGDPLNCNLLGNLFRRGQAVSVDNEKAAELYESACKKGLSLACHDLASMYLNGQLTIFGSSPAPKFLAEACRLKHPNACLNLTMLCAMGKKEFCTPTPLKN